MSITLMKPKGYKGTMHQTSLFQPTDNYPIFRFQPTEAMIEPYESARKESKWNNHYVSKFELISEDQRVLAVKTLPVEMIGGAVETANLKNVSLWKVIGAGKNKKEVFNDKLKYTCKAGVITCHGEM